MRHKMRYYRSKYFSYYFHDGWFGWFRIFGFGLCWHEGNRLPKILLPNWFYGYEEDDDE